MKILIIKPSSLGDIIHSLPFLKAIKDTFREAEVEWVISKNLEGILQGHPLISKLIVFDKDSWKNPENISKTIKETIQFIKTLRSEYYDMVIDLQGLLRSGLITSLVRSPVKAGFKHAREGGWLFYNKKVSVNGALHAVDKSLEVAKALGAKTEKAEFPLYVDELAKKKVKRLIPDLHEYIVIVPSARWETKKWPSERFGALIPELSVPSVITGSTADRQTVQQVTASSGGRGIDLCGKTDLKELTVLIAGAKVLISNDSGPLHIGTALGVPVVALFGPTDPMRTGPYGWSGNSVKAGDRKIKVIRSPVSCSPCFKKKCSEPLCMSGISVETVLKEVEEYL